MCFPHSSCYLTQAATAWFPKKISQKYSQTNGTSFAWTLYHFSKDGINFAWSRLHLEHLTTLCVLKTKLMMLRQSWLSFSNSCLTSQHSRTQSLRRESTRRLAQSNSHRMSSNQTSCWTVTSTCIPKNKKSTSGLNLRNSFTSLAMSKTPATPKIWPRSLSTTSMMTMTFQTTMDLKNTIKAC